MPTGLKLLSIANDDGSETLGAVTAAGVVDVRAAAEQLQLDAPLTLEQLLREGSAAKLEALIGAAVNAAAAIVPESEIKFGRLFTNPSKIICLGLNYKKHAIDAGGIPRVPPLFNKYNNALAAHNSVVTLPPAAVAYKIDYETELLVVIGKAARGVQAADAMQYVAGYSVGHDLSARDLQMELPAGQWMLGKTLDGFGPIGPYFVGADLVPNPDDLKLETRVNGEVVQEWSTNDFIFNVQETVAYLSKFFTLNPGDIIFTGTPQGSIDGKARQDQHWLKAGDEIVSTIESLGELKFKLA
jgi:2-keto-4-pentenoate hydratase/2-oxohepta-3-ene-1,7-dioic acid hydratase in catechol pathway